MIPVGALASSVSTGGGLVWEFLGSQASNARVTTTTFSGMSFGTASADRVLIAVVVHNITDTSSFVSASIGGVSATVDVASSTYPMAIFRANVTSGTSGDVVVTYGNDQAGPGRTCGLYRVEGPVAFVDGGEDIAGEQASVLISPGLLTLAGAGSFNSPGETLDISLTNQDFTGDVGASYFPSVVTIASATGDGGGPTSVEALLSAVENVMLVAAAYEPA